MQHELSNRLRVLEEYIAATQVTGLSSTIQSNLLKFGTVLICGYIERSVEIVVLHRLTNRAHPKVINFVKSHFKRGSNSDCNSIHQLLIRFDQNWADNLQAFIESNPQVEEQIKSVYSVRNSVAHGGNSSTGSNSLTTYLNSSRALVDAIVHATRSK